jgi:hypothetical protein
MNSVTSLAHHCNGGINSRFPRRPVLRVRCVKKWVLPRSGKATEQIVMHGSLYTMENIINHRVHELPAQLVVIAAIRYPLSILKACERTELIPVFRQLPKPNVVLDEMHFDAWSDADLRRIRLCTDKCLRIKCERLGLDEQHMV